MKIKQLTNQEFKNFTENFYIKSVYQTIEYAFVMQQQGYESILIGLEENDIIIAASLLLIKKESGFKYAYAPRGFLINYEDFYLFKEFTSKMREYLNTLGIIAVKINPIVIKNIYDFNNQSVERNEKYNNIFDCMTHNNYYHFGYNNFFEALKPRFEAVVSLNGSINNIFKNIKKEYRTKIRSAVKNGVEIYKGNIDDIELLYNFTKHNYPRNLEYFKNCFNYFSKENKVDFYYTKLNTNSYLKQVQNKLIQYETKSNELSNLVIKQSSTNKNLIDKKMNIDKYLDKYKGELVRATKLLRENQTGIITSAIMVIKHGFEVTVLIDGFDPKYGRFNSKHLLIWKLIETYHKKGYKLFNLGGVSNIVVDANKYTGLNDFKTNFGAKTVEYAGDFELMVNKRSYNLYRNYVPLKNLIKSKLVKDSK